MATLANKVAVVTGAGSGIGKAAAILFAREGAAVGILDIAEEDVAAAVREITAAGGKALPLIGDVSNPEQVQQAMNKAAHTFGQIDVVYANAGINGVWAPIEDLTPEDWNRTLASNLSGTFYTIKYAVPYLKEAGGGSVIITASVNGTRIFSNTGATAYSTTKAGQVAMAQMLALELAKHKIRVNVICPGAIKTNISKSTHKVGGDSEKEPVEFPEGNIPLTDGEPGQAEQVAQLALFLASDASSHISGTPIWIDGAESLLVG